MLCGVRVCVLCVNVWCGWFVFVCGVSFIGVVICILCVCVVCVLCVCVLCVCVCWGVCVVGAC